jgi:hypothetical protein
MTNEEVLLKAIQAYCRQECRRNPLCECDFIKCSLYPYGKGGDSMERKKKKGKKPKTKKIKPEPL